MDPALTEEIERQVRERVTDEGEATVRFGATAAAVEKLPVTWSKLLAATKPTGLGQIWRGSSYNLIDAIGARLQAVGLLTTTSGHSLLYVFRQDQDVFVYRGGLHGRLEKSKNELAARLDFHGDFWAKAHDGFADLLGNGVLAASQFRTLEKTAVEEVLVRARARKLDPKRIVLVCDTHSRLYIGMQLKANGNDAVVWDDDEDKVRRPSGIREVVESYLFEQIEDFDPV